MSDIYRIRISETEGPADMRDPRQPDGSRRGIFRHHNCWKCQSGEMPCASGNPHDCEYPHARND